MRWNYGFSDLSVYLVADVSINAITTMRKQSRGFSLIEIILAIAIAVIVCIAAFQFITVSNGKAFKSLHNQQATFPMYNYGEKVCPMPEETVSSLHITNQISMLGIISTSTPITSIHFLGVDTLLITTDSASTSEPDIFILNAHTLHVESKIDVGPGIQDSILLDKFLYIANTSINSHIKVFHINGTVITELQNIKLPTLAQSGSLPKILHIYDHTMVLGSEKSNAGGELFPLPILANGLLSIATSGMELGGQAHQSTQYKNLMITTDSADPELRVFDRDFKQISTYDAPLTAGNGKSILAVYPLMLLGRTLGSGELTLLSYVDDTHEFTVLDLKRTNGSVDFLQPVKNTSLNTTFLAFTSNTDKEVQIWKLKDKNLEIIRNINMPGRIISYACKDQKIINATLINNIPTLIWLEK